MRAELILEALNDSQREAVAAPAGAVLVLAGAGSGKTRVLTRRIAWVIATEALSPDRVMAVTFTNKAAAEMRGRVEHLLGTPTANLWIGTFHGLSHRLLRRHAESARLPVAFHILDSEDQLRLIRRLLKSLALDEKRWPVRQIAIAINQIKDEGETLSRAVLGDDAYGRTLARIFGAYEETCERSGLVDFAELILRTTQLFSEHPEIANHYRTRFRHLLVDEFQDTNTAQYLWMRTIAGDVIKPFVVGDDDQSIYGWRGARIENVQRFQRDFAPVTLVRLEQNYRSTGQILAAANAVISRNRNRLGKSLWTAGAKGQPIEVYAASDERDEATYAVARIERWIAEGGAVDEIAVLYRSNAQSRVFEETLIGHGLPYRVYGGVRFFERTEVKDVLAYLRIAVRRDDDTALERIINVPARGIGSRTLDVVRDTARRNGWPLWQALCNSRALSTKLGPRARGALGDFVVLVDRLGDEIARRELSDAVAHVIDASGLRTHYAAEGGEQAETRLENLDELISAASEFAPEAGIEPLAAFLAQAALEAGDTQAGNWTSAIKLMTLHAAKGLEFPLVIIAGLEEGLFPHQKSSETPAGLEEERRLFYVGMTRARAHLVLSYAERRRLHGQIYYCRPSRFLAELPQDSFEETGPRRLSRAVLTMGDDALQLGRRVSHATFGEGVILDHEGEGARLRIKVAFEDAGVKWLVAAFADLHPIT